MLRLEVTGQEEVQNFLTVVLAQALDPVEILDEAAALLLARIRTRFLTAVGPDEKPWVPSFAAQIRSKTGRGGGTLYDTGRLFTSIQVFSDTSVSRKIGTDVPYAGYHQFGTENLPARPFIGVSNSDTQLMNKLIENRIRKALK